MTKSQEPIEEMLIYVIDRCVNICNNLNLNVTNSQKESDCANKIKQEASAIIKETLSVYGIPFELEVSSMQTSDYSAKNTSLLSTPEGRKSLLDILMTAEASIAVLNKERCVDQSLLHQPFGMIHKSSITDCVDYEDAMSAIDDDKLDLLVKNKINHKQQSK